MQHCVRCDQDLPLDAFHPGKQGQRGTYCRRCSTEYKRQWKLAHGYVPRDRRPPVTPKRKPQRELSTTYGAVHLRLRAVRGSATAQNCWHCGLPAEHWAYDHADPDELIELRHGDRRVETRYSTNLDHYIPLCVPCHSRYDGRVAHTSSDHKSHAHVKTKW